MNFNSNLVTTTHRSHSQKKNVSASQRESDANELYTIEVSVVLDLSIRIFHNNIPNNITEYVLSLMSIAASVFEDASIGNMINIAVVSIENLNQDLGVEPLREGNAIISKEKSSNIINYW